MNGRDYAEAVREIIERADAVAERLQDEVPELAEAGLSLCFDVGPFVEAIGGAQAAIERYGEALGEALNLFAAQVAAIEGEGPADDWSPDMAGGMTMDELLGIRDELGLRRLSAEDLAAEVDRARPDGPALLEGFYSSGRLDFGIERQPGSTNRFELFQEAWAVEPLVLRTPRGADGRPAPVEFTIPRGYRCSPEAPCPSANLEHIDLWGECFVRQPDLVVREVQVGADGMLHNTSHRERLPLRRVTEPDG